MSENSKKIYKLLRLAKDLDEPSFQRKSQYQSFKVKKHIQSDDIQQFIEGLVDLDFNEEGIFWLKKSLAFYSRDDLEDRLYIFMRLYACYKNLENHEMVLEFGNKALEIKSLMIEHNQIPEGPTFEESEFATTEYIVLNSMIESSENLQKPLEAMEYRKRVLQLCITGYNKKQRSPSDLLFFYKLYIQSQIENKCFNDALKTFEKLRLYSLNSSNPQDVKDVFKAKHENLVRKLQQLDPIEAGKLSRSKNCPTKALGFKAGELCELKGIIFAKLGDMVLSDNWIQVGTQLFREYQITLNEMITRNEQGRTPEYNPEIIEELENVCCKMAETFIRLSSKSDLQRRMEYFAELMISLQDMPKSLAYYVGRAKKKYSLDQEDVRPFVDFFIGYCQSSSDKQKTSEEKDLKPMVLYKNSLGIMNHFTKRLPN